MNNRAYLAALVLAAWLGAPAAALSQAVIENTAAPAAPNAGRVLELAEVWRITDDGGKFSLQQPVDIQIAEDGSVFIVDTNQILKFSSEGKFLENVLRLGTGPGELKPLKSGVIRQILVRGSDLYFFDYNTLRCWRADLDGRFEEELGLPGSGWSVQVGIVKEGILFWRMDEGRVMNFTAGAFFDFPEFLSLRTWKPGTVKDIFTLTNRTFVSPRMAHREDLSWALSPDGQRLYFSLGSEYLIHELDLASRTEVRKFRRPYHRVPAPKPKPPVGRLAKRMEEDRKNGWLLPEQEYLTDIQGLRVVGDQLWVSTSTKDKANGSLIDVFDKEGRYVDCFYARWDWGVAFEGSIFCIETNGHGTFDIVKYRIVK